ncbi:MAG: O-methyltransferase [Acidobacteria bacterium]|nr:MAG: O-methyltransferase [Acidobacteriota bacterium]REK01954.1 MAG: O-methyltransferase [Acidobacteriota bacterium]REK14910.1 MAG: O-methyltransferase [Acidobacteriota bacterium]REK45625.1 MAG: O-methyltransferase [Acidobacteriota bacterium]
MIDEKIQRYAERFSTPESDVLRELRLKTFGERQDKNMLSGFYQGRLLSMISRMIGPAIVLEIGTYVGYSAICLAEGLRDGGKVITLDVNEETNAIAQEYWRKAGIYERIDARLGDALEVIDDIDETIDLVFIDADKENYSNYFDLTFPKLRKGGLIIADNVLWSGDVVNAEQGENVKASTKALHEYNEKIDADPRVSNILLAVRDGLMIARKERE